MRHVPEELAARIESGAATLCHVWLLERRDGRRMGFTDHDCDVNIDGVICVASSGWACGAVETALERAGGVAVSGGLDTEAITEADIEAGLYDAAAVGVWRVDWNRPDLRVRLWQGRLSKLRREGERFTADLDGPLAALERVVGRTFGRDCDADLGDARCGVDLSLFPGATCDRRWETCTGRFNNGALFRGFPDIPGDDFLMATPGRSGPDDGGSRR